MSMMWPCVKRSQDSNEHVFKTNLKRSEDSVESVFKTNLVQVSMTFHLTSDK